MRSIKTSISVAPICAVTYWLLSAGTSFAGCPYLEGLVDINGNPILPTQEPSPPIPSQPPPNTGRSSIRRICHGFPCPRFNVKKDYCHNLQGREYKPFYAVVVEVPGCLSFNKSLYSGYIQLMNYRHGHNSQRIRVPMSVPVIVNITLDDSLTSRMTYQVWFYVNASALPNGIPEPIEANMYVKQISSTMTVLSSKFSGFIEDKVDVNLAITQSNVPDDVIYDQKQYIVAIYHNPNQTANRRNEIWLQQI